MAARKRTADRGLPKNADRDFSGNFSTIFEVYSLKTGPHFKDCLQPNTLIPWRPLNWPGSCWYGDPSVLTDNNTSHRGYGRERDYPKPKRV
jgi:hypothetical protein